MTADPSEYTLARVSFDSLEEGAAFIAALSRVIASPTGAVLDASSSPIEVRAEMLPSQRLDVFLSPSALAMTRAAFGEPRIVDHVERRSLPIHAMQFIYHWPARAYGQEEIVQFFGELAGMVSASNGPDDEDDMIVRHVTAWPHADFDRASDAWVAFKVECRRMVTDFVAMTIGGGGLYINMPEPLATFSFARKHMPDPYEEVMDWLRFHPLVRSIEVEIIPPGYY